jgi:hypothetical protein
MRVEFKFRESTLPSQRQRVVVTATKLGATRVGPLFPRERDPQLASIYKADGVPVGKADRFIAKLAALPAVEFAERTPSRKLIR